MHLWTLPPEILSQMIPYLDSVSLLRFCRAVPRLNEYADALYKTSVATSLPLKNIWPNVTLDLLHSASPTILRDIPFSFWDLMNQFGGSTIVSSKLSIHYNFPGILVEELEHKIDRCLSMVSKNVSLIIDHQYPGELRLWANILLRSNKILQTIYYHNHSRKLSAITDMSAEMKQSLIDLNPRRLYCAAQDSLLDAMPLCTNLYHLILAYYDIPSKINIPNIIVQTKSLKILSLRHIAKESHVLNIIRVLAQTNIQWLYSPHINFYENALTEAGFFYYSTTKIGGEVGWWYRPQVTTNA